MLLLNRIIMLQSRKRFTSSPTKKIYFCKVPLMVMRGRLRLPKGILPSVGCLGHSLLHPFNHQHTHNLAFSQYTMVTTLSSFVIFGAFLQNGGSRRSGQWGSLLPLKTARDFQVPGLAFLPASCSLSGSCCFGDFRTVAPSSPLFLLSEMMV